MRQICQSLKSQLSRAYVSSSPAVLQPVCRWQAVIGLEIHAQISANSKLFSASEAKFAAPTNTLVSFFDAALPGTLPVLSRRCVEAAVLTALALECDLNLVSTFDRKHYFYADMPAGFQITQQRRPLATGGRLAYMAPQTSNERRRLVPRVARLVQLQLEQDSGKSLHNPRLGHSLIDLNRAGVGLMEIITQPDFSCAEEAAAFIRELQLLLQSIGTCTGKMEEGTLRVDASVSVHEPDTPLGVRSEVKNLNSVRSLTRAIEFEVSRQVAIVENGGTVANDTRSFDVDTGETVAMRDKEGLHDYRFMPEPNLPPLRLYTQKMERSSVHDDQVVDVDVLRASLPELPVQRREHLMQRGLPAELTVNIVNDASLYACFEHVVSDTRRDMQIAARLFQNELIPELNSRNISLSASGLKIEQLCDLVDMLQDNTILPTACRKVLQSLMDGDSRSPRQLTEQNNLSQITDVTQLDEICQKVMDDNPQAVADYRKGNPRVLRFFVSLILNQFAERVHLDNVTQILRDKLNIGIKHPEKLTKQVKIYRRPTKRIDE